MTSLSAKTGELVVIEGLDGSGKTTQADLLVRRLERQGSRALLISFPDYASRSSALVQMYLGGELGGVDEVNAYAASSFYAVDRYASYQTGWKKEYLAGHTIVANRYSTSNAAHQLAKLPREEWDGYLKWLEDFEYHRLGLPRPNLVVYLDMHPNTSRVLLSHRYEGDENRRDLHESNFAYLMACREGALYAADKLGWRVLPCCDGAAPLPVEEIARKVWAVVHPCT